MDAYRIIHTIGMCLKTSGKKRAAYLKRHNILYGIGRDCMFMPRKIPLYPKLIKLGNNVWIASDVKLVTHDVIHSMLNNWKHKTKFNENMGFIDIGDNVFIGANSIILPNVKIKSNTVIAAGSVVSKSLEGNGVYGGAPAKYICPIDNLTKKRQEIQKYDRMGSKGRLPKKTVEAIRSKLIEE